MAGQFRPEDYGRTFDFGAGWLCLDFANTINYAAAKPKERLGSTMDLIAWGCISGLISYERAIELTIEAEKRPDEAAKALETARALRFAIHEIFSATLRGQPPETLMIEAFNGAMSATAPFLQIKYRPKHYDFDWTIDRSDLNQIVPPVIWSAMALLTSRHLGMVKICQSEKCSWLFLDETRNHSRRWCNMSRCGNQAKATRFYRQHIRGTSARRR